MHPILPVLLVCILKSIHHMVSQCMFVTYVCFGYTAYTIYNWVIPYYWMTHTKKNGEISQLRMRDAISTCVFEEIYGNDYIELAFTPHQFHGIRNRGMHGYGYDPDDIRCVHVSTFNRKHKAKEHYMTQVGDATSMRAAI